MTSNKIISTAVILAAGRGTRLKKMGESIPKGFIEVANKPIIEESIERLLSVGIDEIIIVTGHLSEFYQELASKIKSLRIIHNDKYAESGSMYSLYILDGIIKKDFILLESDLVYEIRALTALINKPVQDCLLVSGFTESNDEVWVHAPNGKLAGLSKQSKDLLDIHGELVGITKLSLKAFRSMCNIAKQYFETSLHIEYETALAETSQHYHIECLKIDDLVWAEIDTEEHLEHVRRKIYPKIHLQEGV